MNEILIFFSILISFYLSKIIRKLECLIFLIEYDRPRNPRHAVAIQFYWHGKRIKMFSLKANDSLPITLQASDEFGNPTVASFDAPPVWSSSDATIAIVAASADGLSATVTSPAGKLAQATIQVSGLVSGATILGSLPLTIVAGDTAEIVLVLGTPVAVAPVAPPAA